MRKGHSQKQSRSHKYLLDNNLSTKPTRRIPRKAYVYVQQEDGYKQNQRKTNKKRAVFTSEAEDQEETTVKRKIKSNQKGKASQGILKGKKKQKRGEKRNCPAPL
jgi:hypothetical protein